MSEMTADVATDTHASGSETSPPAPQPALSVAEHAKAYGPGGTGAAPEDADASDAPPHHSAQQKREKDTGKFDTGKSRHRAESAKARPEDVPRIQALTGRAKSAEERVASLEAEVERLKAVRAPAAQVAQAEAKVEQAQPVAKPTDAEPTEDDPAYGGDYGKYLDARQDWRVQRAIAAYKAEQAADAAKSTAQKTVAERVAAARARYQDFDTVADRVMGKIPPKSAVESWVFSHTYGDDVLYYFDSHPDELDAILRMPTALDQFEAVTLLAQRFRASPQSSQAGTTGSVAGRPLKDLPPKPPNPVRTEAQRVSESAPTDGTLSIMKHAKAFARR